MRMGETFLLETARFEAGQLPRTRQRYIERDGLTSLRTPKACQSEVPLTLRR
jgi:hypothetical protein